VSQGMLQQAGRQARLSPIHTKTVLVGLAGKMGHLACLRLPWAQWQAAVNSGLHRPPLLQRQE